MSGIALASAATMAACALVAWVFGVADADASIAMAVAYAGGLWDGARIFRHG